MKMPEIQGADCQEQLDEKDLNLLVKGQQTCEGTIDNSH